jgi:hypothetical protein
LFGELVPTDSVNKNAIGGKFSFPADSLNPILPKDPLIIGENDAWKNAQENIPRHPEIEAIRRGHTHV